MSWADDQAEFMRAGGQTVDLWNRPQALRYARHVSEEASELRDALMLDHHVQAVDAAVDCIVVCIGFLLSLGIDPDEAWATVHRANMRKVVDGELYRRPDGQIGKPPGWVGPEDELAELVNRARGVE